MAIPSPVWAQRKKGPNQGQEIPFFGGPAMLEQFFGNGRGEDQAALQKMEISYREESEYGKRILDSFYDDFKRRKIDVLTRGREVTYLRRLVDTLRPLMRNSQRYSTVDVILADTEITDAYSIPGGTLIVFRGMLELTETEAALAGVLAHELSHLDRGHQLLPLRRMKASQQNLKNLQNDPSAMFRQAGLLMSAFMKPFRPEDEMEADLDAVQWTYQAGYHPGAMSLLFARLNERDKTGRFTPSFLRTHPYHAERQAAVDERLAELQKEQPRDDLYLGRTNLKRRIPMNEQKFPE